MKNWFKPLLLVVIYSQAFAQITVDSEEYNQRKSNNTLNGLQITSGNFSTVLPAGTGHKPKGSVVKDKTNGCDCYVEPDSSYILAMQPNDDGSSAQIDLPFSFCFYGDTYNSLYINNNGNVTFENSLFTFTPNAFPSPDDKIIAPFWGDVDTRGTGEVVYKITPTAIYINWKEVGYYNSYTDKVNDFQLTLTDGTDPAVEDGNIAFCYKDMQWTTGDASEGVDGFGGFAATAGANKGDNINYFMIAQFDHAGTDFDGALGNADGISWLDNKSFYFNICNTDNIPPIPDGMSSCDTVTLCAVGDTANIQIRFLSPEQDQITTLAFSTSNGLVVQEVENTPGNTASILLLASSVLGQSGYHTVTVTATDNFNPPGVTNVTFTLYVDPNSGLNLNPVLSPLVGCDEANLIVENGPYDTYLWDDLSTLSTSTVDSTMVYGVTVSKDGCYKRVEELITIENSLISLAGSNVYCTADVNTTMYVPDSTLFGGINWNMGNPARDTMFINDLTAGNYTITFFSLSGFCQKDTTITITEVQTPVVDIIGDDRKCDGVPFNDIIFTGTQNTQFDWVNNNPDIGVPASGTGNIIGAIADGTVPFGNVISGTITVTPSIVGGCAGDPKIFTLIVDPAENGEFTLDDSFCSIDGLQTPVLDPNITTGGIFTATNGLVIDQNTGQFNVSSLANGEYSVTYTSSGSPGFCPGIHTETFTISNPIVNAGTYSDVCIDAPNVTLTGSPIGGVFTGTGTGNGLFNPNVGTQTITYTYTDPISGCTGTNSTTIVVNTLPTIDAGATQTICFGENVVINATGGQTYTWDNGLGAGSSHTVNPTSTTFYNVIGTDNNGCVNTDVVQITVNQLPIINAGNDLDVCMGNSTFLNATGAVNYTWDNGVGNGNNILITPSTNTTYTVTGTDANGCQNTDQVDITMLDLPIVNAGLDTVICVGTSVVLTASGAQTYVWDNNLATNGETVTPITTTAYNVIGQSANGCVATDQVIVTVLEQPIPIVIPSTNIGTPVLEISYANQSLNANNFTWDFGNGSPILYTNGLSTETVNYETIQTYTFTFTASNGVCTNDTTFIVEVINFEPPVIIVPNIFTPDGDEQNNWYKLNVTNTAELTAQIYNRWGHLIAEISGVFDKEVTTTYWDGTTKNGKEANEGVYFITYQLTGINGEKYEGQENIQLVRK